MKQYPLLVFMLACSFVCSEALNAEAQEQRKPVPAALDYTDEELAHLATLAQTHMNAFAQKSADTPDAEAKRETDEVYEVLNFAKKAAESLTAETRVFQLSHAEAQEIAQMVSLLNVRAVEAASSNSIVVIGPARLMPAVEAMIDSLDVVRKDPDSENTDRNVELTMYLLQGTMEGEPQTLPDALGEVVYQLTETFPYKSYKLIDTLWIRGREDSETSTSGVLPVDVEGAKRNYNLMVNQLRIAGSGENSRIQLDDFVFGTEYISPPTPLPEGSPARPPMRVPAGSMSETGIRANVDLKVGQSVVVGKSNLSGGEDAMFVVVTGKIVE
ncbi:MAG: hypothetical protein AMXMBFR84_11160 [Candidatus Hydrogenedentota bacterium]